MDWFDDLMDTASDKAGNLFSNYSDQFIDKGLSFIGIGAPPKTNLTAKQVMNGELGSPTTQVITSTTRKATSFLDSIGGTPVAVAGGLIILALLLRR